MQHGPAVLQAERRRTVEGLHQLWQKWLMMRAQTGAFEKSCFQGMVAPFLCTDTQPHVNLGVDPLASCIDRSGHHASRSNSHEECLISCDRGASDRLRKLTLHQMDEWKFVCTSEHGPHPLYCVLC